MNELVSVVIPTHNRRESLSIAIDSVLKQSYKDIEIIVISDGSTDDTNEYMNQFVGDPKIVFLKNEKPMGANYCRNMGIEASKGNYIAFLDDDDEWYPDKIQSQISLLKDNDECAICFTGKECFYYFDKATITYISSPSSSSDPTDILVGNYIGTNSSVLIKKVALVEEKYDLNLPALQDWDLWIRILKNNKSCYVNKPLVKYNTFLNSNTKTKHISSSVEKYKKAFALIENKHLQEIKQLPFSKKRMRKRNMYSDIADRYMRNNMRMKAFLVMMKSCFTCFSLKDFLAAFVCFLNYRKVVKIKSLIS